MTDPSRNQQEEEDQSVARERGRDGVAEGGEMMGSRSSVFPILAHLAHNPCINLSWPALAERWLCVERTADQ